MNNKDHTNPNHYKEPFPNHPELKEVIHISKKLLSKEEFRGAMMFNILKYRMRAGQKMYPTRNLEGSAWEDIRKAEWYREQMMDSDESYAVDGEDNKRSIEDIINCHAGNILVRMSNEDAKKFFNKD